MSGIPPAPPPPSSSGQEPSGPQGPDLGSVLSSGWDQAIRLGTRAFAAVGLVGQAIAFFAYAADQMSAHPSLGVVSAMRIGGFYFFGFHHVGMSFSGDVAGVGGGRFGFGIAVALLLVTGFAGWLLYRSGRRVAATVGGGPVARALHGAKVGVPYAVFSLILSFVVSFSAPAAPGDQARVHFDVGHVSAFFLPLLIGVVAGGVGGLLSIRGEVESREPWGRRAIAALVAGWQAFVLALVLAFVGLLVLAAAKPDDTRAYVDGVTHGVDGAFGLTQHVLALPNQSIWVLVAAVGGCDGIYGGTGRVSARIDLLCYGHFPRPEGTTPIPGVTGQDSEVPRLPFGFGTAPKSYFLFLLVPAISVLWGGAAAARRAGASHPIDGLIAGALSGVAYGGLVSVGAWLGGVGLSVGGGAFGVSARISGTVGPRIGSSILLGLLWGLGGGAIGGAAATRRIPRSASAAAS